MATRDVQLIIKAKDEASRALASVAEIIGQLDIKQRGTAASGKALGATLAETAAQMAQMERATGLVVAASDRAEASIARQRKTIADTGAELASVERQLAAAQQAIGAAQSRVVDARLAGGNGNAEVASLLAAQQAARDLEQQQQRLTRTLQQQQGQLARDEAGFQQIASAANTAEAALVSFGDEAQRASLKAAAASEQAGAAAREHAAAQAELNRVGQARTFFDAEPLVSGAKASETALAGLLRQEEQQDAALLRLQDRIDPLSAIQRKLAADTEVLAKAQRDGRLSADQYTKQLALLQAEAATAQTAIARVGRGAKGPITFLGLKPYELTNLGYQVNDIVSGLASGQHVMQILAQQGGQVLQLIPGLGARLVGAFKNPYILAAAVSLGAVATALKQASNDAERLRKVEALLQGIGDGAGASAQQLAATTKEIERIGLTADQAFDLTRRFVTQGLNPAYLKQFAQAAINLSDITGQKVPESMDEAVKGFTTGYKAIAALDDKMQFLTVAEREQIRAMFDSGDAAGARRLAFEKFAKVVDDQARKERGPWKNPTIELTKAWDDLLDTLGRTDWVQSLTSGIESTLNQLDDLLTKTEDMTIGQIDKKLAELKKFRKENPIEPGTTVLKLGLAPSVDQDIAALEKRRAELLKLQGTQGDIVKADADAQKKRENDAQREIDFENAKTDAQRERLAGEKAFQEALEAGYSIRIANEKKLQAIQKQRDEDQKKAEQERQQREAKFAENIANNGRSGLLSTAQGFVGRNENRAADRNVLQDFFKAANVKVDPKITAWCAAFVNAVLATNGLPTVNQTTGGSNVRAKDFLAFGSETTKPEPGDIVILKGAGRGGGHVGFFQGFTDKGDVRVLGGNQSNGVNTSTFKASSVLGFRRAPSLGDVAKLDQQRDEAQAELNRKIDDENAKRQITIDALTKQQGLSGVALIDAQREEAVQQALASAREEAKRKGEDDLAISQGRLDAIRKTVEEEFNLQHARERAQAALEDASAVRESLLGKLNLAEQNHDAKTVSETLAQLQQIDNVLRTAIADTIAFYQTLGNNPQVQAQIQNLRNQLQQVDRDMLDRQRQIVEKPVTDLQAQRNGLLEQIQTFRDLGQTAVADQLLEQLHQVDGALLKAIDTAIAFWQTQTGPEAQAAILNFQNLRQQVIAAENEFVVTAKQIQDAFAGSLSDGIEAFAQKLVETRDPLQALATGALTFASEFLKQLAEMGLKMLALKLATKIGFGDFTKTFNQALGLGNAAALGAAGASVAAGGAAVTAGASALGASSAALAAAAQLLLAANAAGGAGVFHGGGIAGSASRTRAVSPAWFAAAVRYHSGGVAGLRPDEVPAILQRGEEIITRSDTRHRYNGGGKNGSGGSDSGIPFTQILAIGEEQIASAMRGASGRKVFLTHLKENRETVRSMLG